jgi:xanthine dehydrogenase small subunit
MALWTVEDIAQNKSQLHPAQEAMVACHGSQCGFCTPGFVMSLFALYQDAQGQPIAREQAQAALSGNLCRCTGYRPILEAASAMQDLPRQVLDAPAVLAQLRALNAATPRSKTSAASSSLPSPAPSARPLPEAYALPLTLTELLRAKAHDPQAQLVAGCTDVGLWITKMHMQFVRVIDTTRVAELRRIEQYPHHIAIGAAVTLTEAYAALVADRPQLASFAHRFAGLPVRNSGTLGGNIANGSPIGDSMPLLIALGANVVLMSVRGHREMPLEDLYTGYRKNVMATDEVLAWVKVPKATVREFSRVYKISKRFEDDISAVCLAVQLTLDHGVIAAASIGVGGVAATPVRARTTQAALQGLPWNTDAVQKATTVLQAEFAPISDMRASARYRKQVLGNLLQRFWLESQGASNTSLENILVVGETA